MKLLALALLLLPFSSYAHLDYCEVRTGSQPLPAFGPGPCGYVEATAVQEAYKAGVQKDINRLISMESEASCTQSAPQAIRTQVEAGNHGKVVSVLVLTEVNCESKYFVANPLHTFPILVKLWANHEETEVDAKPENYLEVKKLYEAQ